MLGTFVSFALLRIVLSHPHQTIILLTGLSSQELLQTFHLDWLCYAMLCHAMLCYDYAMLCYAMTMLCYAML